MFQSDKMGQSNLHSVKMADLRIPIANATAVIIGRNVYLAGGLAPDARSAQIVQVYNIDTGKWSTLPPAPQCCSDAGITCEIGSVNKMAAGKLLIFFLPLPSSRTGFMHERMV